FLLSGGRIAHGLIQTSEAKMHFGLFGVELFGAAERGKRLGIFFLLGQEHTKIELRDANVLANSDGTGKKRERLVWIFAFQFHIAEVRKRLRVLRIERNFILKRWGRLFVAPQFPIEIAKAKVYVRSDWIGFRRGFEFRDGLRSLTRTIERLAQQHVRRGRLGR